MKPLTDPDGAARLLLRLRILLGGIIGVRLDRLDDLELAQDRLLGVLSSDGEDSASNPLKNNIKCQPLFELTCAGCLRNPSDFFYNTRVEKGK